VLYSNDWRNVYRVIAFDRLGFGHTNQPKSRTWTPTLRLNAALASQAGKPKGGCERDDCGPKKDFVAFLFIRHNVLEAL
jgi:hypothetical protein